MMILSEGEVVMAEESSEKGVERRGRGRQGGTGTLLITNVV